MRQLLKNLAYGSLRGNEGKKNQNGFQLSLLVKSTGGSTDSWTAAHAGWRGPQTPRLELCTAESGPNAAFGLAAEQREARPRFEPRGESPPGPPRGVKRPGAASPRPGRRVAWGRGELGARPTRAAPSPRRGGVALTASGSEAAGGTAGRGGQAGGKARRRGPAGRGRRMLGPSGANPFPGGLTPRHRPAGRALLLRQAEAGAGGRKLVRQRWRGPSWRLGVGDPLASQSPRGAAACPPRPLPPGSAPSPARLPRETAAAAGLVVFPSGFPSPRPGARRRRGRSGEKKGGGVQLEALVGEGRQAG